MPEGRDPRFGAAQDGHGQDRKSEAEAHLCGLLPVSRLPAQPIGSSMPPWRRTSRSTLSSDAHSASSPTAPLSPGKVGSAATARSASEPGGSPTPGGAMDLTPGAP